MWFIRALAQLTFRGVLLPGVLIMIEFHFRLLSWSEKIMAKNA